MDKNKKIEDIYACKKEVAVGNLYPLQIWYNDLLDKMISQIDISDIMKMIRQNIFTELAVELAIEMLLENSLIGENFEGDLLENIYEKVDYKLLVKYKKSMIFILKDALVRSNVFEWIDQEEKDCFDNMVISFLKRLS